MEMRLRGPRAMDFILTASYDAFLASTSFPVLPPTWNQIGNPLAPKRDARDAPSDTPDSEIPETGRPAASEREDL